MMAQLWLILGVVNLFVAGSQSCSLSQEWRSLVIEERLFRYDIVVIGTDMRHVTRQNPSFGEVVDSIFKVACVLKGDTHEINETITIKQIEPRNSCQYTITYVGEMYIVGLERTGKDYKWHEVNVQISAFEYNDNNLKKALTVCGLQELSPPYGAVLSMCPPAKRTEHCVGSGMSGGTGYNAAPKLLVIMSFILTCFVMVNQL